MYHVYRLESRERDMENRTEQWGPLQIKIKWEHDEYSDEVEADCIAEAKRMATEVIVTLSAGMAEAAEFQEAEAVVA